MIGVYIPGTKMPKCCYECLVRNQGYCGDGMQCGKTKEVLSWHDGHCTRGKNCPLVSIPTTDANPVAHGKWKWVVGKAYAEDGSYELETPFPYCTNCGKRPLHDETSAFCPYCGADMREKVTEK